MKKEFLVSQNTIVSEDFSVAHEEGILFGIADFHEDIQEEPGSRDMGGVWLPVYRVWLTQKYLIEHWSLEQPWLEVFTDVFKRLVL